MTFKYNNVYVTECATVAGPYEKDGPLGNKFDKTYNDLYIGEKSFESAEVRLMEESIELLLKKSKKIIKDIMYDDELIEYNAGDVVNHLSFGRGVVVGVDERFVTVAFKKEFGIKKFLRNYKGLRKE